MYNKEDRVFLCDWVQGSLPMTNVNEVFEFICSFDAFQRENFTKFSTGFLNFKERYGYNDSGIVQIAWCSHPDNYWRALKPEETEKGINPGIFISFSGDGLRKLGYENHNTLFKWLYEHDFSCTRIDVAMDIFDEKNLLVPCITQAFENIMSFEYGDYTIQTKTNREGFIVHRYADRRRPSNTSKIVKNCECRSKYSELGRFKMYDKWFEIVTVPRLAKCKEELLKDIPGDYWYRLEYTIKKKYSESLFREMCEHNFDIVSLFKWAVGRFFTVVIGKTAGYAFAHLDRANIWIDFITYLDNLSSSLNFNLAKLE